ncbi:LexA family transcriptional regulator [Colwellia psychrerythraea]|uniref:Phage C1 repressor n=1 Tax=Colwellia psychrerythraea TaxID=28229 RepID=A0A099K7Y6_COLPS|nr:S24 family peptidase [Colwellia psychrerythraea]KGJ86410.1 phage C1 repressor [Colwellia psychrerythraea]
MKKKQEEEKSNNVSFPDNEKETFSMRLEQAIGTTSIRMFANAIDISEGALRKYLKGISLPQIDKAMLIAKEAGVSLNWLITGEGSKDTGNQSKPKSDFSYGCATVSVEEFNEEYALIPGYHISVSTGHGALNNEAEVKRQLAFRSKWLRYRKLNPNDLAVVFAKGDSMEPTINSGNTILVDLSNKKLTEGSIYVLRLGEDLYAKRLQQRFDGSIELISDNKEYITQTVKPDELEQLEIIGKVVWIGKDLY